MQRIVRWNVGMTPQQWRRTDDSWNDLDGGHVSYVDVTAEHLAQVSPRLHDALTHRGRLGTIVQHTYSVEGGHRIFTFVVLFD
ncbi:hypothetical protein [Amycolatopsis sp. CA-230715]|uniref:hypothetical protein n=1 Tax=Amycolatopsis sp. CA-230715 TaxID=2745196 RepID=UPI001C0180F7|nr:hypothetical protein [Amycolatopsis sp. CA-230715]QWF80995.1 hypothetical protein HUW46_04420 [Amycolatopsis sp. CA-230715]